MPVPLGTLLIWKYLPIFQLNPNTYQKIYNLCYPDIFMPAQKKDSEKWPMLHLSSLYTVFSRLLKYQFRWHFVTLYYPITEEDLSRAQENIYIPVTSLIFLSNLLWVSLSSTLSTESYDAGTWERSFFSLWCHMVQSLNHKHPEQFIELT